MQAVAKSELNESADQIARDLAAIKLWLAQSPHIRARDNDGHLITFLRGCKYSLEKTKRKLESFYTTRSRWYHTMTEKDPIDEVMLASLDTGFLLPLNIENSGPGVPLVVLSSYQRWDPHAIPVESMVKCNIKQTDVLVADGSCAFAGVVLIVDFKNYPIEYFNPSDVSEFLLLFKNTMPIRLKAVHLINVAPACQIIINLVKTFMDEKLRNRILLHKTLEDLHQQVQSEVLPQEYGGKSCAVIEFVARWKRVINEHAAFLANLNNYGIDETKRLPSETQTANGIGSFRSLAID